MCTHLFVIIIYNPSAGIGRQDKLKIYWYFIVDVQVVFRINNKKCMCFLDLVVKWLRHNSFNVTFKGSNPFKVKYYMYNIRGYSLNGKTAILHIVNLGSSPNISMLNYLYKAREAQPGRAELWRCLGYKFKSYLEHLFLMWVCWNW